MKTLVNRFCLAVMVACALVLSLPSMAMAQPPDLPDIGIDLGEWVTSITGAWFGVVATVLGFVFIAAITWKGAHMLKRRLTPTK